MAWDSVGINLWAEFCRVPIRPWIGCLSIGKLMGTKWWDVLMHFEANQVEGWTEALSFTNCEFWVSSLSTLTLNFSIGVYQTGYPVLRNLGWTMTQSKSLCSEQYSLALSVFQHKERENYILHSLCLRLLGVSASCSRNKTFMVEVSRTRLGINDIKTSSEGKTPRCFCPQKWPLCIQPEKTPSSQCSIPEEGLSFAVQYLRSTVTGFLVQMDHLPYKQKVMSLKIISSPVSAHQVSHRMEWHPSRPLVTLPSTFTHWL